MAILSPADGPSIIKMRLEPMKKYVLAKMGGSIVDVELTEDQFECVAKTALDFIAQYFPKEQKLSVFWTQPMKSTYPLPSDAYWIQAVNWDPVTTRVDDIFGAESYLFCLSPDFKILDKFGSLQPLGDWKKTWIAKTNRGNKKLKIVHHDNERLLPKTRIHYESGVVEATNNHVIKCDSKWREFSEVGVGCVLNGVNNTYSVQNIESFESSDAIGVRSPDGAFYGCTNGSPILIH